jgi:hypothetical protein
VSGSNGHAPEPVVVLRVREASRLLGLALLARDALSHGNRPQATVLLEKVATGLSLVIEARAKR